MIEVTSSDFALAACQATYFTPGRVAPAKKLLFSGAFKDWLELFDGEPALLPEGAPPDVPWIILRSRLGNWECRIASARIDIFWRRQAFTENEFQVPAEFHSQVSKRLEGYVAFSQASVGRVGTVVTWMAPHPRPGLWLSRHFCKTEWHAAPLNRPQSFEIHAHKVFRLSKHHMVNSWVRCKTALRQQQEVEESIILVEQDVNTVADPHRFFQADERADFFNAAYKEIPAILRLYFPNRNEG